MRTRLTRFIAAGLILGGGLLSPRVAPGVAAADSFKPDGRILVPGGGVFAGLRTCAPDCDLQVLTSDPTDTGAAWSPTGRQVAFTRQVGNNYLLHVLDITTGVVTQLTSASDVFASDSDPDWSPNGSQIAFTHVYDTSQGAHVVQIGIVSLLGGAPVSVFYVPRDSGPKDPCLVYEPARWDPTFSPDGTQIAYVAQLSNPVVLAKAPQSGAGVSLASVSQRGPTALSDGGCVLLAAPNGAVFASSAGSHETEHQIAPGLGQATGPAWSPDGSSIALVNKDGPWVVPLNGASPIAIRDSTGNRPHPIDAPGSFAQFHTGWDPGGQFLVVYPPDSGRPAVKYKPDGSGDLDTPAGTHASGGWSVQCVPSNCLTALTVRVRVDGAYGTYPSTFHFSGTVAGDMTVDADLHTDSRFVRLKPGAASVTMAPNADWPLTSIECDAPATVNLAARSVALDIPLGFAVTCEFLSDIGVPLESGLPPSSGTPAPTGSTACSTDTDGDGYCDGIETVYGSDPGDGSSYPVTPPGYWEQPDHGKMGPVPERMCDPGSTHIDPCVLQPGDVIVTRHVDNANVQNLGERFFGDTWWTHSILFVGFFELGAYSKQMIVPVVLDITPSPDGRAELALSDWGNTLANDDAKAVRAYRSRSSERSLREAFARNGMQIALDNGAGIPSSQHGPFWDAPSGHYTHTPAGWGPRWYYCSSLISSAYGFGYSDFHGVIDMVKTLNGAVADAFVTPDDMIDGLPDMHWVLSRGVAVGYGSDGRGFSMWSPANLMLTDPQGNRAGWDADGNQIEEIEGANVRLGEDNQSVTAPDVGDDWTITVTGTGDGEYHLISHSAGDDIGARVIHEGTTATGKVETFQVGALLAAAPGIAAVGDGQATVIVVALAVSVLLVMVGLAILRRRRVPQAPADGTATDPKGPPSG